MLMFQRFREEARQALAEALKSLKLGVAEVPLVEPPKGLGELSSTVAFELASKVKRPPAEIAKELAGRIKIPPGALIARVEAVKGYLNFYLNYERAAELLIREVKELAEGYGRGGNKGRIILEHTSANPDGPLHIGHGRNAVIGDALARVLRFSGYEVETQFYVNDMGRQLAVVVWGLRRFKLDKAKKKDLAISEVYVKANELLAGDEAGNKEVNGLIKGYEEGDEKIKKEFKEAADYCLEGIRETLRRLGVSHDRYVWESAFVRNSSVSRVIERLRRTEYAREEEVLALDLKKFGIEKELVLSRSDGTHLYATRDIAYHLWKAKHGRVIDVLGADHKLAAQHLKAVHRILGIAEPEFIIYEFISLPEGAMSTRRGVFVSLDELMDETVKRAYAEVEKRREDASRALKARIAEAVGVGAVRFNILRVAPEKAMVFNWEEALDFERQGSPFVQYAYARACRILEKGVVKEKFEVGELSDNEKQLVKTIAKFPGVVMQAAQARKPSIIAGYAVELADSFHRFYMFEQVLKSEKRDFRLNLVLAAKITLGNVLYLLGIEALEQM
jgi:arginyl-tRNA synthetase